MLGAAAGPDDLAITHPRPLVPLFAFPTSAPVVVLVVLMSKLPFSHLIHFKAVLFG